MQLTRALVAALLLAAPWSGLVAQDGGAWNGARALELIGRAQERRADTQADTGLASYRADARGHVYFFLDRQDTGDRTLVKTDQVALEVFWQAPASSKQRIVGWRDQKTLPTTINYHIDHLAVVQDNFGDQIRLGDGDEVRDVPHPAGPGAREIYEYRLADSTVIQLPGAAEPVRVYQVQVRPRDASRPAFVGSVFVEQRRGDLVRMDFTFTPSAYVDRQLDYINVSLDNGLWKGRFWLPNQQRIEIRRQLPELDFPAGGVIRGTMRIGGYQFNQNFPPALFAGAPVVLAPRAARQAFQFERGIHEELREEGGIDPQPDLEAIRRQAAELARARVLSGLPRTRLNIGAASDVFRYNRAEGAVLSAGASFRPAEAWRVGARAGWAFGAGHPLGELEVERRTGTGLLSASLYGNQPRDVGVGPVASGVINTLAGLTAGRDYTDLFYASGVELGTRDGLTGTRQIWVSGRVEAQRSAQLEVASGLFGTGFREVRPIDDGTMIGGALGLRREAPTGAARSWGAKWVSTWASSCRTTTEPLGTAERAPKKQTASTTTRSPSHACASTIHGAGLSAMRHWSFAAQRGGRSGNCPARNCTCSVGGERFRATTSVPSAGTDSDWHRVYSPRIWPVPGFGGAFSALWVPPAWVLRVGARWSYGVRSQPGCGRAWVPDSASFMTSFG